MTRIFRTRWTWTRTGTLYAAQFSGPWLDKYVLRPDADPARGIGQIARIPP